MTVFSLKDIPEFSKKQRIVVVGVIGKSPYRYPNKSSPLLPTVKSDENGIECHWDERRGILYLHAVTYLDTKRLAELAANLNENSKSSEKDADAAHWLVASGELAAESCRIIALLFQLCHIVVLSSPTSTFDLGYLQLFKAIDAYRNELTTRITASLSNINATGAWETHGRSCCPRLLFHFRRAPAPLSKNIAALKRLEHATEDQLYFILRKTRIITNVCAKSLFAIPKNEEFVYINAHNESNARDISSLVRGLVQMCDGAEPQQTVDRPSFTDFLQAHVDRALNEGFDDNVGKYAMSTSFFELPSASSWRAAAAALTRVFLEDSPKPDEDDESEPTGALYDALATDVRFSSARCAKVLPIAQASYTEGLPSHYSSQHHAHKVSVALGVLSTMARGPLAGGAASRLRAACASIWRTRTLCEAPSLTGHHCTHPDHDDSKEHSSGVRYVSACDCGRGRTTRDDPYTVREANYTFYTLAATACTHCDSLERVAFPVFRPSTPTFKAAVVKPQQESWCGHESSSGEHSGSWTPPDGLSDQHATDVINIINDTDTEKSITRQASTTEYLPGMLHTGSPSSLLPAFPSWSLVCLGPSSLYSHALGLPEHLQPGLLPHTNCLLPWDTQPRAEQLSLFRTAMSRGRGKSTPHITVKIFIGFEYECPRGHRFMMSSPDSVMTTSIASGPGASAAGARLAQSDMPLVTSCPCRGQQRAALTRLHVVTPKAALHVTLEPKAQPIPNGPIFIPQPLGSPPIKLSPSAYWVLRLPYMYEDERGPLPRDTHNGRLIAPVFGLVD